MSDLITVSGTSLSYCDNCIPCVDSFECLEVVFFCDAFFVPVFSVYGYIARQHWAACGGTCTRVIVIFFQRHLDFTFLILGR